MLRSPALSAAETADALDVSSDVDARLADWDTGAWRGRTLDELLADEPAAVAAWLGDPDAVPHGGESLTALLARASAWMAGIAAPSSPAGTNTLLAITHAAVVRAAVVAALDAPPTAFWALDVAPLSLTDLRHRDGRWHLRAFNR